MWSPALHPPGDPDCARRMSQEVWCDLPEDVDGELARGVLVEEEVTDPIHALCASWFIALLRTWLAGEGFVFDAYVKLLVRADSGRKADASVVLPTSARPPRRGPLRSPPDIVIEVVTPTPRDERRDRVEKMDDYAAFGVPNYWLVDPALGSFEVFVLGEARKYTRAIGVTSGRLGDVPSCPGLVIDLDALWAELGRLGPED